MVPQAHRAIACALVLISFLFELPVPRPVTFSKALRYPRAVLAATSLCEAPAPASQ